MIKRVSNNRILAVGRSTCLSYRKGRLYYHTTPEDKPNLLGAVPYGNLLYSIAAKIRLCERILRLEPRGAIECESGVFLVSCCGMILRCDIADKGIQIEHKFRLGMRNPLAFCRVKGLSGIPDCVAYGEYWGNEKGDAVNVVARINGRWQNIARFEPGKVLHIHGLAVDSYRNQLVIATGDSDVESGLWSLHEVGGTIEPIITGSQSVRSCFVVPTKDGYMYTTDTPLEANALSLVRATGDEIPAVGVLAQTPGPCTYGMNKAKENSLIFSTTVEGDSRLARWRYIISRKLGPGVRDRYTHILKYCDGQICEIAKYNKDVFPMLLFQPGNVLFLDNTRDERIFFVPQATIGSDNKTYVVE